MYLLLPSYNSSVVHAADIDAFETLPSCISLSVFPKLCLGFANVGADLKERARMSDAEADHFVQRLRSLMDNIGKYLAGPFVHKWIFNKKHSQMPLFHPKSKNKCFENSLVFSIICQVSAMCYLPVLNLTCTSVICHSKFHGHYLNGPWDHCDCLIVWAFFSTAFLVLECRVIFSFPWPLLCFSYMFTNYKYHLKHHPIRFEMIQQCFLGHI